MLQIAQNGLSNNFKLFQDLCFAPKAFLCVSGAVNGLNYVTGCDRGDNDINYGCLAPY